MSSRFQALQRGLAIIAWLAQLWLPMAHAGMGLGKTADAKWCGTSPAYAAQLAQLPRELRQLLDRDASRLHPASDCVQCLASGTPAVPAPAFILRLPVQGLDTIAASVIPAQRTALSAPPHARGPPSRT